ncbi:hypothetical protein [Chryseobacterium luquanense]|uniref:WGR domain-containing protein n=1 Tax=Chryseobacterium luquanense TaxID=2983766 RepID=A0ABT3Y4L4_9FLAO|nr:hypothetical protein [Chryseobacterium luquanense]MCX8533098.1 hypothetical protein [Chryseobacterium luquanense]
MRNQTTQTAQEATVKQNNEDLVIVFQNFNGVFLAKISNNTDRKTYAYGSSQDLAQENAINRYNRKYNTPYFSL